MTTVVVRSTPAQQAIAYSRQHGFWGRGFPEAVLCARDAFMTSIVAELGHTIESWVLAPASNPTSTDFFASCELHKRSVLLPDGTSRAGWAVAAVLVPEQYRRQGHAERMLTLLQDVKRQPGGKDDTAVLTVLYSAIGDYYSRCGYHLTPPPIATTFTFTSPPPSSDSPALPPSLLPIHLSDLPSIATADISHISSSLPPHSFALAPTSALLTYQIAKGQFILQAKHAAEPPCWGFELPGPRTDVKNWGFIILRMNYDGTVHILRFRPSSDVGKARELLKAAVELARGIQGAKNVVAWGVPEEGREGFEMEGTVVETAEWVKTRPAMKAWDEEVREWAVNEVYAEC